MYSEIQSLPYNTKLKTNRRKKKYFCVTAEAFIKKNVGILKHNS